MVFYFKARPEAGDYTIFMGLDKYENEELIKYGFPEDIWYRTPALSNFLSYSLRLSLAQVSYQIQIVHSSISELMNGFFCDVNPSIGTCAVR